MYVVLQEYSIYTYNVYLLIFTAEVEITCSIRSEILLAEFLLNHPTLKWYCRDTNIYIVWHLKIDRFIKNQRIQKRK